MELEILCQLLNKTGKKMTRQPYPGSLGIILQERYSEEAWKMWLEVQTKLINEERLNPLDKTDRQLIEKKMIAFFSIKVL